ncbi:MAG: phosphoribosyltransferase [Anaerolineaceae bacterium]|nr:phosphoribosyltransferase [Anaerolineaceae bacterium]
MNSDKDFHDLDYWKQPEGITLPHDRLKFLYIPDYAEHLMISWLAARVFDYQREHAHTEKAMRKMVMITMGALLPGVLLQDYLTHCADETLPAVEFGTFGVKCYHGPGQPLDHPQIVQPLSIDVRGHTVGVIEDLIDLGETARFVQKILCSETYGAREVVFIAPYYKDAKAIADLNVISFGAVPPHTWIITPRERVETMVKRVPYWKQQGATADECRGYLRDIGYTEQLLDQWFEVAWVRG